MYPSADGMSIANGTAKRGKNARRCYAESQTLRAAQPDRAGSGAMQWGLLDAIFEQKEYGEGYVLERLAGKMIAAEPERLGIYELVGHLV
jgi:hypothetical protein